MKATPTHPGLSGWLRRVDAALADWVARAFPGSAPEVALAAALASRAVADGHSALELDRAQAWLETLAGSGESPVLPDPVAWREALRRAPAVGAEAQASVADVRPLVLDAQGRVYLRRYFGYERRLATALVEFATCNDVPAASADPAEVKNPAGSPHPAIDPEQQRAVDIALEHRLTLVTGGPGSGKTHSVVQILAALARRAHARGGTLRVALAAPTGKAAARLRESIQAQRAGLALSEAVAAVIPTDAHTVHRLIGASQWRVRPHHHAGAPLPFDVVVVDEVSMVDLPLMAKLVDAIPVHARLVLLGDPDQLSAVEAGNVLGALADAAREAPLDACHARLTCSHRFGPDSTLGALARAIADGDPDAALAACDGEAGVVLADGPHAAPFLETAADAYRPVLEARDPADALRAARGFRVLTALRQGPSGCVAIDRAITARLQRAAGVRADTPWWRGRLVLVTANRPELGLFNGDTGVAWPDGDTMKAWFEGPDGVPRPFAPAMLPPHEGAFALTVHKAQGSEFGHVALVTGPDSAVLTRELLYTGITRARDGISLYTTADVLRAGIGRRTLRMTGLADRLREAAAATGT